MILGKTISTEYFFRIIALDPTMFQKMNIPLVKPSL